MYEKELREIKSGVKIRENLITIKNDILKNKAGELLKSSAFDADIFPALLKNEDPKVRKNAAQIIGELRLGYAQNLMDAYLSEGTLFVKGTYLEALYKLNYRDYLSKLTEIYQKLSNTKFTDEEYKHVSDEVKILAKMLENNVSHSGKNAKAKNFMISCGKDMIPTLLTDVSEIFGKQYVTRVFCGAKVTLPKALDFSAVKTIRYYRHIIFPLNGFKTEEKDNIAKAIAGGDIYEILGMLSGSEEYPYRFRLSGKNDTGRVASEIAARSGGRLLNDSSDYEIEIKIFENREGKLAAGLIAGFLSDKRFAYRKNYVSTSMTCANCAGIIRLVRDYLKEDAQIIDPFCGVGTLLFERVKAVKANQNGIYGTDIFANAVKYARENAKLAGIGANFIQRDFFDFKHDYGFDEILTELPDISGDYKDFTDKFFAKARTILKKDGVIIIHTDKESIVKSSAMKAGFTVKKEFTFETKPNCRIMVIA